MMIRNDNGDTPLHAAAFEGHLDQVPAALLTSERVGAQLRRNFRAVARCPERGFLGQIPEAVRPRPKGPVSRLLRKLSGTRAPF
jgi:ankyrin repeat protein